MSIRPAIRWNDARGNVRTVEPAAEPVTAAELRTQLNETATGLPDAEANIYIAMARDMLERATGLAFITQTWRLSLDRWPGGAREDWWDGWREGTIASIQSPGRPGPVILPVYPLQSITSVTTYNEASVSTAVTVASVFDVDTARRPGRMTTKSGQAWPTGALRALNAIEIVYVAGYGASSASVPASLVGAVRLLAAYLYAHRGDGCEADMALIASGAFAAASMYAVARL